MITSIYDFLIFAVPCAILTLGLAGSIYFTVRAIRRKKLKPFAAGLIGWFIYQLFYTEFLATYDSLFPWWVASIPISLFLIALFFLLFRKSWIAPGIFTAVAWNAILLVVSLALTGGLFKVGSLGILMLFPPFFWYLYQFLVL